MIGVNGERPGLARLALRARGLSGEGLMTGMSDEMKAVVESEDVPSDGTAQLQDDAEGVVARLLVDAGQVPTQQNIRAYRRKVAADIAAYQGGSDNGVELRAVTTGALTTAVPSLTLDDNPNSWSVSIHSSDYGYVVESLEVVLTADGDYGGSAVVKLYGIRPNSLPIVAIAKTGQSCVIPLPPGTTSSALLYATIEANSSASIVLTARAVWHGGAPTWLDDPRRVAMRAMQALGRFGVGVRGVAHALKRKQHLLTGK